MIDKEIWKTKTDGNKMEKLIKCHIHMQVQHQKSVVLKKKTFSSYPKTIHCFFFCLFVFIGRFKNTPRPNWEIQTDWENDV